MAFLDAQDRERLRAAIEAAERRTSGELVTVIARASDRYRYIPLLWAAVISLSLPGLVGYGTWLAEYLAGDWPPASPDFSGLYVWQLASFALLVALFQWPALKMRLIPRHICRQRAARLAREQFLVQGIGSTRDRTGVLIFVSVAEHYVEIIADQGIYTRVDPQAWSDIVDELVRQVRAGRVGEGFVAAVESCGIFLATHFPRPADDRDELPNHLIEL
ncbi:MAG: TPM domain-containing protein [Gammaproteobacteria bacterium]|nr:TPM domain-containing protein [Gammaproteobacteria bacterium]